MTSGCTEDGEDDDDLFRRVLGDTKPIKKGRSVPEHPAAKAGHKVVPKPGTPKPYKPVALKPKVAPPSKPARALATGDVTGMDRRNAERFRRGKLPIEGRLDLHGMHQDAAHHALTDFITSSAAVGKRNVLVITGRGSREGSGVLRERLPQWLNQPPCHDLVVAFTGARPEHGRDGAFYVLLRRNRDRDI
ncbi:MAG: Smr/MutS family protein [Alphaproteobacteria bacterium]|jgi:DNA-nicking Smr family endonuclease|nr:Smr/MutS family protein [Alphaproteobacteria bacterium]